MAELIRAYSNFRVPPIEAVLDVDVVSHVTLVQQSEGLSPAYAGSRRPAAAQEAAR